MIALRQFGFACLVVVAALLFILGAGYLLGTTPSRRTVTDSQFAVGAILAALALGWLCWTRWRNAQKGRIA